MSCLEYYNYIMRSINDEIRRGNPPKTQWRLQDNLEKDLCVVEMLIDRGHIVYKCGRRADSDDIYASVVFCKVKFQ